MRWALDRFQSGVTQHFAFTGTSEKAGDVSVSVEVGRYEGLIFRPLSLHKQDITVSRIPLLVFVNRDSDTTSVTSQERVLFDVVISNKGDVDLENLVIDIDLPLQIIRANSFSSDQRSKVIGDAAQINYELSDALKTLLPAQEKTIQFGFQLQDFTLLSPSIPKKYTIGVTVKGITAQGNNISNKYDTEIQLEGTTTLSQKVLRSSEILQGQGPLPPVVGEETSYIVVWEINNNINSVDRAQVEASLPRYVTYKGVVRPANQNIEYNATENSLRWSVGEFAELQRTVHFEIWVTPNQNDVGKHIPLVQSTRFSAHNSETKQFISQRINVPVTTALSPEAGIQLFEGIVEDY